MINLIDSHVKNVINRDIKKKNRFSEDDKTALVRPFYKKKDQDKIQNYRTSDLQAS